MNAEQLLDALCQLPDDLIAQVDTLRVPKKKTIPWKRILPIAASLALVIGAVSVAAPLLQRKGVAMDSQCSVQEAAPQAPESAMEPESPAEKAPMEVSGAPLAPETDEADKTEIQVISVTAHTFLYYSAEPNGTGAEIISSLSELESCSLQPEELWVEAYDEAFFEENQLIFLLTDAASSSVRYDVRAIQQTAPGSWELTGNRIVPEWCTEDMTHQLIIVELPRMMEPEDAVILNLKLVME